MGWDRWVWRKNRTRASSGFRIPRVGNDGIKLTWVEAELQYSGALEGATSRGFLMLYQADGTGTDSGWERFTGRFTAIMEGHGPYPLTLEISSSQAWLELSWRLRCRKEYPMESLTKVSLSAAQLEHAVAAAFGPGVTVVRSQEFGDGWFNTIHGLELSDGRKVALKVAPKAGVPVLRYEADLLATEVAVYGHLSGVDGVRVPRVWFHETTGSVLGLPFFLMDWIEAPTYAKVKGQLSETDRTAIERNLGAMNRRIHSVTGPAFGSLREPGFRSRRWSDVVSHLVADVLADGQDKGTVLPWSEDRILGLVETHRPTLDLVTVPSLVHWDLHDGNTFVDGTEVRAVIDGDRALWGDPLMEIYFSDLLGPRSFVEGYGPGVADSRGAKVRRAVYDVYLGLVMVVECDYRGFTDEHRAWTLDNLTKALAACQTAR